jgi:hypothetical protein
MEHVDLSNVADDMATEFKMGVTDAGKLDLYIPSYINWILQDKINLIGGHRICHKTGGCYSRTGHRVSCHGNSQPGL